MTELKPPMRIRYRIWKKRQIDRLLAAIRSRTSKLIIGLSIISVIIYSMVLWTRWDSQWDLRFQSPVIIQNFIKIEPDTQATHQPLLVKQAKAKEPTVEDKIKAVFGSKASTFIAISKAESGTQAGQKGYNCYYGDKSKACKPGDENKAWSVDCGLLQVNVYGRICPYEMYDIDYNLQAAKGKYDRQGFNAWTVCKRKIVICK